MISNKKFDTIFCIQNNLINLNGKLNIIHKENDKEFSNKLFDKYCEVNNIKIIRSKPYHPQSQGIVGAYNKEAKKFNRNEIFRK